MSVPRFGIEPTSSLLFGIPVMLAAPLDSAVPMRVSEKTKDSCPFGSSGGVRHISTEPTRPGLVCEQSVEAAVYRCRRLECGLAIRSLVAASDFNRLSRWHRESTVQSQWR